jgi:hypothetical protein
MDIVLIWLGCCAAILICFGHTRTQTHSVSPISEERQTGAPKQFLVFGNDREVPLRWLERYGALAGSVPFFFLSDDGHLEVLQ